MRMTWPDPENPQRVTENGPSRYQTKTFNNQPEHVDRSRMWAQEKGGLIKTYYGDSSDTQNKMSKPPSRSRAAVVGVKTNLAIFTFYIVSLLAIFQYGNSAESTYRECKHKLKQNTAKLQVQTLDGTRLKSDLASAMRDYKTCSATKFQLQQTLEQTQASEKACLEKVSKCAGELGIVEQKLTKARRQLEDEAGPLKEEEARLHASAQALSSWSLDAAAQAQKEANLFSTGSQMQASDDLISQAIAVASQ